MKKIMLMIFLLAGITTFASAQDTSKVKKTPEERAAQKVKMMQKKLNLTADQSTQITTILTEQSSKAGDMKMKGVKGGGLARMEAMAEADKKINAILTPDQQKTYAAMEQKVKDRAMSRKKVKDEPAVPVTPAPPAQ